MAVSVEFPRAAWTGLVRINLWHVLGLSVNDWRHRRINVLPQVWRGEPEPLKHQEQIDKEAPESLGSARVLGGTVVAVAWRPSLCPALFLCLHTGSRFSRSRDR